MTSNNTAPPEHPHDLYCVFGNPIAHSKSPQIHTQFAQLCGQHMVYERRLAPLDGFETELNRFFAEGGCGCNITVPFKVQALDWAKAQANRAEISARAALAGACNTLRLSGGNVLADNTDGAGLVRDLCVNLSLELQGKTIVLLGAGGAAAGALGALIAQKPAAIYVWNRTLAKAEQLCQAHQAWALQHHTGLFASTLPDNHSAVPACDLVINASSSSLNGSTLLLPAKLLKPAAWVYDMMYGPASQVFLDEARRLGARTSDGLGMLVEQAAEAFAIWRDVRPPSTTVLASMRAQLLGVAPSGVQA